MATWSALTRSQPGISRPCITATVAVVVAHRSAVRSGSTWTSTPPWPLALIAMCPRMRKASPPNIFFSVSSGSGPIRSLMRPARTSS